MAWDDFTPYMGRARRRNPNPLESGGYTPPAPGGSWNFPAAPSPRQIGTIAPQLTPRTARAFSDAYPATFGTHAQPAAPSGRKGATGGWGAAEAAPVVVAPEAAPTPPIVTPPPPGPHAPLDTRDRSAALRVISPGQQKRLPTAAEQAQANPSEQEAPMAPPAQVAAQPDPYPQPVAPTDNTAADKRTALLQSLATMGLSMMKAGGQTYDRPVGTGAIVGEAGLQAMGTYQNIRKEQRDTAFKERAMANDDTKLAIERRQAMDAARFHNDSLALDSRRATNDEKRTGIEQQRAGIDQQRATTEEKYRSDTVNIEHEKLKLQAEESRQKGQVFNLEMAVKRMELDSAKPLADMTKKYFAAATDAERSKIARQMNELRGKADHTIDFKEIGGGTDEQGVPQSKRLVMVDKEAGTAVEVTPPKRLPTLNMTMDQAMVEARKANPKATDAQLQEMLKSKYEFTGAK